MTVRQLFLSPRAAMVAAVAITAGAGAASGAGGSAGMALGIVGATFNLWALNKLIGMLCGGAGAPRPGCGAFITVLAFFVKLPLIVGLGFVAYRLGRPSMTCFLLGVGLVYSALLGWVLARGDGPP